MGEITYMTGAGLSDAISATSQAVSGMSIAEAAATLGGKSYATNGLTEIMSFPINESKGGQPMTMQAQYASQLWDFWKTMAAGAGITSLGAAAAAAKSWASGVLFGDAATAGTLAGTGGLLTMSLPAVAAAAAPVLGVSLGGVLYQSNPEFWEKISRALLPWAYKDTDTMGIVVDNNGQVYMPKEALLSLKNLFDSEGVGQFPDNEKVDVSGTMLVDPIYWVEVDDNYPLPDGRIFKRWAGSGPMRLGWSVVNGIRHYFMSSLSYSELRIYNPVGGSWTLTFNCQNTITIDGKTVYTGNMISGEDQGLELVVRQSAAQSVDAREVAWNFFYTYSSLIPTYPTGLSRWNGNSTNIDTTPVKPVVTDSVGNTKPYFPITIPIGDPVTSPDPAVQPSPTAPIEFPDLDPYISPQPSPEMWPDFPPEVPVLNPEEKVAPQYEIDPVYLPNLDLDPNINPSAEPSPDLDPAQEPAKPIDPPKPSGVTPGIVWPPSNFPTIVPTTGSGLVHVYNPTSAELISFGNWLWVTYADPDIDKLWNNPFDGIIGAHELYATPSKDGTDTIKSGFLDSEISSTIVQQRYISINCGSIVIPEYYGNYLDYSPYSKAFIYLPFIGIVEVDVDDIVGHSVNILYHIDSYNGSCIAQVTVAKDNYVNTIYQFSGNCAVDIPLAGGSQAAIRAGMISAAAYGIGSTVNGVINGAALGSIGGLAGAVLGGATGAIGTIGAGVANVVSQKSTVQHSGSFGASYGAMGIKKPYIIIRRPVQKFVNQYNLDYGYPAYIRVAVGACSGYLRVREVNVQSSLATDDEKVMIENLLKSGVYID